jgi:hypothetical protein
MVNGCPDDRQAQGNIDAFVQAEHFDRTVPLVVIHCDHQIEIATTSPEEQSVGRQWTNDVQSPLPAVLDGGRIFCSSSPLPKRPFSPA